MPCWSLSLIDWPIHTKYELMSQRFSKAGHSKCEEKFKLGDTFTQTNIDERVNLQYSSGSVLQ